MFFLKEVLGIYVNFEFIDVSTNTNWLLIWSRNDAKQASTKRDPNRETHLRFGFQTGSFGEMGKILSLVPNPDQFQHQTPPLKYALS